MVRRFTITLAARRLRPARRFAAGALLAVLSAAQPALGQSMSVFGDPGGEACYRAARMAKVSPGALDDCDFAIASGKLGRKDLTATYINRGIVHSARGDHEAALEDYLTARRLTPGLPESYVGEGNVAFMRGRFADALAAYDAAIAGGLGKSHLALFNRALTFEKMGRWDDAEAAYREAAALAPDWELPGAHLARLAELRAAAAGTN